MNHETKDKINWDSFILGFNTAMIFVVCVSKLVEIL